MKTIRFALYISIAMLTIFSSCKKEETVDLCTNGFLDPGETAPDCGGNCAPCTFTPSPYLDVQINGVETTMTTKSLTYNGSNWILAMANDSLGFSFDFGSTGSVGSFPMPTANTSATLFGLNYPDQTSGNYVISNHNLEHEMMSGYFQIKFSRPGFTDTIFVTNGVFGEYSY